MRATAILAIAAWSISCKGDAVSDSTKQTAPTTSAPSTASLAALASTPIYFGHQSVGRNIIDGLAEIGATGSGSPLRIIASRDPVAGQSPALVEFTIGENGRPDSKIADFSATLQRVAATPGGIAMFKYCYLDITPGTDVDALFAKHRAAIRELRTRHPNLTFVHVTAPLTTDESGPRLLAKRLLGKPTARDANARRNAFNTMLKAEFAGDPIFDLAKIESTRPDGSRSYFTSGRDTVFTLAPELTDDGGHLNAAGRRAAAQELLSVLLGTLASDSRSGAVVTNR